MKAQLKEFTKYITPAGTPPTSHRPPNFTMSNVIVNVSSDLLWAITRNNSSYIVKRGVGNERVTFSKEPLNLTNKHSRKHSGLVNEKAVGVQANNNGGVTLITKKSHEKYGSKPASLYDTAAFSKNKSQRKTYAAIVNRVAKKHYRPDLRQEAVARASAIKRSQRPVKPTPASKLRGVKAKAAAEKA
ncbi:60S ribosomal protein L28 [Morchella snyderi]|nr:60S ribosomal protein L28 [Morchella snyderi]